MRFNFLPRIFATVLCIQTLFHTASAQICQGSLGDPVINKTFGTGTNPGQPLGAGITNYNYVSNSCPNDGQYTIANSTAGCFGGSWFSLTEDHTPGDVNGYMMIVNASNAPGDFYVETVQGLCENTTYEFASWILNVHDGFHSTCNPVILPNVTFKIETTTGIVLQTFQTGNIAYTPTATWKQYGFNFSTPPGTTSVVLRMTNNAPGGCGNDLILDDITFRPCGAKVTATATGGTTVKDLCAGDTSSLILSGTISAGYTNPFYQWQLSTDNGSSWQDIAGATAATYRRSPTPVGNYYYRLTVAEATNILLPSCRVNSENIIVRVNNVPAANATNDGPHCEGQPIALGAANGASYQWTGPAGFTSTAASPVINNCTVANAGKYYIRITTAAGCTNTDSTVVVINSNPLAFAGNDVGVCEGGSVTLQGSGGATFAWSPSTGLSAANIANPVATPTDSTLYILTVSNGTCSDTDSVLVTVTKKPVADAGPDQQIFQGNSTLLQGTVSGASVSYFWTPGYNISSTLDLQPLVSPLQDTTYTLHAVSQAGCGSAEDEVFVRVFQKITIPNVFSPNNDGINDVWRIDGLNTFPESELQVFDRFGRLVFSIKGYTKPWNGTSNTAPLPVGTYYYILDLKNGLKKQNGTVTILR